MKLALITGASSGIGEALARLLAQKGISLILNARNKTKLEALKKELPVEVTVVPADLTDRDQRKKLVDAIHEKKPDLVINNAGFGLYGEALEIPAEKQLETVELNCAALLELSLAAAETLRQAGKQGVILNVSSAAAYQSFPLFAVYAASKAFVNSLSEALDEELKPYGIRCLASCPGVVDTHFRDRASQGKIQKKPPMMMTASFAAEEIWKQIQSGKAVRIFDWRYRLLTCLSRLLPKSVRMRALKKSIRNRSR